MTVNYAPDYAGGVYVVPGTPGGTQSMTFAWTSNNAAYKNEFGYVIVDSATGAINNVAPGSAGYAQALLSSANRSVLFAKGQNAGATTTVTLSAGKFVVFYMIQNNTTANFLAKNPTNAPHGNNNSNSPLAFFSVAAANPDGMKHVQIVADGTTGFVQYNWEDLYSQGDSDFNDAAITARVASQSNATPGGIRAPGSTGNENLSGTLVPGSQTTIGRRGRVLRRRPRRRHWVAHAGQHGLCRRGAGRHQHPRALCRQRQRHDDGRRPGRQVPRVLCDHQRHDGEFPDDELNELVHGVGRRLILVRRRESG
jgi:hypothetical protein